MKSERYPFVIRCWKVKKSSVPMLTGHSYRFAFDLSAFPWPLSDNDRINGRLASLLGGNRPPVAALYLTRQWGHSHCNGAKFFTGALVEMLNFGDKSLGWMEREVVRLFMFSIKKYVTSKNYRLQSNYFHHLCRKFISWQI